MCELVLNGIGGATVAQALATISVAELGLWRRYRAKVGGLNAASRNEWMLAQLAAIVASANGAKDVDIYDFAPAYDRPVLEFGEALALG